MALGAEGSNVMLRMLYRQHDEINEKKDEKTTSKELRTSKNTTLATRLMNNVFNEDSLGQKS